MSAAELPRTLVYLGAPGATAAGAALPVRGADTAGQPEPAPSTAEQPVPPVRLAPPDRSPSSSTPGFRKARAMAPTTLDPRTALVVIDLQNGIAAMPVQPHSGPEVVARTAELADAFRARDLPVVLVRVSFAADGSDAVPAAPSSSAARVPSPRAGTSSSTNCPVTRATSRSPSATGVPSTAPVSTSSCAAAVSPRSC